MVKRAESTAAHIRASEALCEYLGREAKIGLADIPNGRAEVWMIQNIHGIQPHFELFCFRDIETLQQIHVEVHQTGSPEGGISQVADLSGSRVDQDDIALRIDNRLVAVAGSQRVAGVG